MEVPPAAVGREAARSSTLAWIALPLAFVWVLPLGLFLGIVDTVLGAVCSVAGAVLAVVVLRRSRHGVNHGRVQAWIALAGTAAHLAVALALGLIFALTTEPIDDPEAIDALEAMEDPGWPLPPQDSVTGDCLLSVERPSLTSCDEPHHVEVAGTYTLPDQGWFDDAEAAADSLCTSAVARYLDIPEDEAAWRYGMSMSADEPHKVACWAVSDDSITGTMRTTRP